MNNSEAIIAFVVEFVQRTPAPDSTEERLERALQRAFPAIDMDELDNALDYFVANYARE